MKFFRLRQRPVENITYIAMMIGFDALLSLVAALLPFSGLFIMLVAPLIAASVSLFCQKRYIPIYILGAIGICIAVTAWDFMNTLFYMVPAVCTGCFFGFLWKAKFPSSFNLFLTSLLSFSFFLLALWLLRLLFGEVDMVEVLLAMIGRKGDPHARDIFPLFAFGYSLAQTGISHIFLLYQLKKLGVSENGEGKFAFAHPFLGILFLGLSVLFAFFSAKVAYFLLGLGIYWFVCSLVATFMDLRSWTAVGFVSSVFGGILVFALLYAKMPSRTGLVLLAVPLSLVCLFCFLNRFFPRRKEKID